MDALIQPVGRLYCPDPVGISPVNSFVRFGLMANHHER